MASTRISFRWPVVLALAATAHQARATSFSLLTVGNGMVNRLSSDGSTVVGYSTTSGTPRAFYKRASQPITLLPAISGLPSSAGRGVSSNGRYVAGAANAPAGTTSVAAFRYDTWTNTMEYSVPDAVSFAYGLSGDGQQVLGSHEDAGNIDCASWLPGQGWLYHGLVSDSVFNFTIDSNFDASLVAGDTYDQQANKRPFVWDMQGGLRLLPTFVPFEAGTVGDVNDSGTVILGSLQGLPVRWMGPNAAPQYIPNAIGVARAMNADGSIIAGGPSTSTTNQAFIWDAVHGTRSFYDFAASEGFNVTGLNFVNVTGMSNDGLIFAGNLTQNGARRGFILDLTIPAPGTLALCAAGLLMARRRR